MSNKLETGLSLTFAAFMVFGGYGCNKTPPRILVEKDVNTNEVLGRYNISTEEGLNAYCAAHEGENPEGVNWILKPLECPSRP